MRRAPDQDSPRNRSNARNHSLVAVTKIDPAGFKKKTQFVDVKEFIEHLLAGSDIDFYCPR